MGKRKRLKEWEALVRAGEIDPLIWMVHFGGRRPDKCGCRNCADYKAGVCEGGRDPFKCMAEKSRTEIVLVGRMDTAHDFALYEREDGRLVWKCIYCGVEVESFEEVLEREDEPCEP